MKEDNNIEEIFRSSFGEFEVTPPPAVKQAVDRAIAAAPWYRRGFFLWLLLLIPVAGIAVFILWNNGNTSGQNDPANQTASTALASDSGVSSDSNTGSGKADSDAASSASGQTDNTHAGDASQNTSGDNSNSAASGQNSSTSGKQRATADNSANRSSGQKSSGSNGKRGGKNGNRSTGYPMGGQVVEGSLDPAASGNKGGSNAGNQGGNNNGSGEPLALNGGGNPQQGGNPDPKGTQTDPPKQDPSKEDPPKSDPPKTNPSAPAKTDSVPKPWKPDSTVKESLPGHNTKKKDDTGEKLWYASIYPGPQLSFNSSAPIGYTLDEKTSFRFSGEINRSVFNGYGITSGFGYNSWSERFGFYSESYDSSYLYTDSVPIYGEPQFPDSITGYQYVDIYDVDTTANSSNQQTAVRTFFIPLYVSKQFAFNDKWGLLTNAGAVFNFYKVTGDSTTTKDFGMTLSGRVHATYKWKNWMFSAGLNGGWDLGVPASYAGYDRKRYWITPQVGIHLTF